MTFLPTMAVGQAEARDPDALRHLPAARRHPGGVQGRARQAPHREQADRDEAGR